MHHEKTMYYSLRPAISNSETGPVFPQIQKMTRGYDYNSNVSVYELARCVNEFPKFTPNLNSFQLNNKAKSTDILSTSLVNSSGMLISSKLKDIIAKMKTVACRYYPASVTHKKQVLSYFWMQLKPIPLDVIDFIASKFVIVQNYSIVIDTVAISSLEEYLEKKQNLKNLNAEKNISIWSRSISFNTHFDNDIDIFKIGIFDNNLYISDRLKKEIEKNKISGADISLAENLLFS